MTRGISIDVTAHYQVFASHNSSRIMSGEKLTKHHRHRTRKGRFTNKL